MRMIGAVSVKAIASSRQVAAILAARMFQSSSPNWPATSSSARAWLIAIEKSQRESNPSFRGE
jgi:hypothetical protein